MSAINVLREELAQTETAQFVTTMLRDISVTKLHKYRAEYETNQKYYSELHSLMVLLQTYAHQKNIPIPEAQKPCVLIAVTANRRFYGALNSDVVASLRKNIRKNNMCECIVIGRAGKQIIELAPITEVPVTYVSFEKDEPTSEELSVLIKMLLPYTEVTIIHPTYVNAFTQEAKIMDITHVPSKDKNTEPILLEYIFEPDVIPMLEFFNTQIRSTLFNRVLLETQVALAGARLMKMQRARERSGEILEEQRMSLHKETSTIQSMRLLEAFASFRKGSI
jgi:ATP synthase F1 gamma subunit